MPGARRTFLVVCAALLAATPALADTIHQRKQRVEARISDLQGRLAQDKQRETALRASIDAVSGRIRSLEGQVGDVSGRLDSLVRELSLRELKLNKLNALYQLETDRLVFLRAQYASSVARLDRRLIGMYEANDVNELDILLSSASFTDLVNQIDYLKQIAQQDKRIAQEVELAKEDVTAARQRTIRVRRGVLGETQAIAVRTNEVRQVRDALVSHQQRLESFRSHRRVALSQLTAAEQAEAGEMDALAKVSASIQAQIEAAQAARANAASGAPAQVRVNPGGLIWPVSAPVTSPFGWRWGRMHEGIDLGAAYGSPIEAAASGSVIIAGWVEGYGNYTCIDHGGGLATCYGHQSQILVSVGQQVSQGQVIGYVGSTGHSTGPHLHFEVRINGAAVDPLGYL